MASVNFGDIALAVSRGEATIEFFPYRKKMAAGVFVTIAFAGHEDGAKYMEAENTLLRAAGAEGQNDNHIAFHVKFNDGRELGIGFTDWKIRIGSSVASF